MYLGKDIEQAGEGTAAKGDWEGSQVARFKAKSYRRWSEQTGKVESG